MPAVLFTIESVGDDKDAFDIVSALAKAISQWSDQPLA
jgi:hypothetical protein